MERYIALLRGINISGKNKIAMAELKKGFEGLGFKEVVTYLNSGNVIFSGPSNEYDSFSTYIVSMIKDKFGLDIPVYIISQKDLARILDNAPDWWGDQCKEIYDNLIFIIPPYTYKQLYDAIGDPKAEYEKVYDYKNSAFWSFSRKDYQKTNWWPKTASAGISDKLTIRTANTVRKIVGM